MHIHTTIIPTSVCPKRFSASLPWGPAVLGVLAVLAIAALGLGLSMAEHEGVAQAPVADPEPLQPNAPEAAEPAQAQHVDEVLQEDAASEARSVAAASSCGGPQLASTARDCGELLHSSEPTACDER